MKNLSTFNTVQYFFAHPIDVLDTLINNTFHEMVKFELLDDIYVKKNYCLLKSHWIGFVQCKDWGMNNFIGGIISEVEASANLV